MEVTPEFITDASKTVGLRQTLKALVSGATRCVIVAVDCDEDVRVRLEDAIKAVGADVHYFPSKVELGRLCDIKVSCACVGILG